MADRAAVAPGATVTFTVVATGPATYSTPCDGPMRLLVEDTTQFSVYAAVSRAGPASACGAVVVAAGSHEVYSVAWPVDPTLPDGTYQARLLLGDAAPLTLPIRVVRERSTC
jgi:hypothetical protein